jgi:serine/threonine-protein kinase
MAPVRTSLVRLNPGDILADRFRILRFISQGGMGDVYEAEDVQLGERVALKTVRPEIAFDPLMMARFKQEIQLAKRVTHPNVCRIHDLGRHGETIFLTMELLDGVTLAQRLRDSRMDPAEALPLLRQMASALDAAHAAGIVHRDFKSPNVMLVQGSGGIRAVVTDFGLARTIERGDNQIAMTRTGEVFGTPDYMAPEQVMADEIGPPADQYALGIVAFEMITAERPFKGASPMAVAMKRLQEAPPRPSSLVPELDPRWDAAILRALDRQPSDRFPTCADFVQAISTGDTTRPMPKPAAPKRLSRRALIAGGGVAAAAAGAALYPLLRKLGHKQLSLAVLPLDNSEPDTKYISDGLTEDLINAFGRLPAISVISRGSVFAYSGPRDPQQAGRRFGADVVLSGSLRGKPDLLSIGVELVDVDRNRHLWGQQYKQKASEIGAVRDDVSQEVPRALGLTITADQRKQLTRQYTASSEAEQFYKKGRFFWNQRNQEAFVKAIEMYKQAIAIDPNYALAYSGLADCYAMQSGVIDPHKVFPLSEAAANKALQLDDSLAEAHAALGSIRLYYSWDWVDTEKQYRRAIELNPSYASAHSMYAMYLTIRERFDEAIVESKRAGMLDPLSGPIATGLARIYAAARQYDRAIAQFGKVLDLHPQFSEARLSLGEVRLAKGDPKGAFADFEKAGAFTSNDSGTLSTLAFYYSKVGRRDEIHKILARLEELAKKRYISPYRKAIIYAALGDKERAFEQLDRAYLDRSFPMVYLKLDYRLESIKTDPRYTAFVRKLSL